MNLKSNCVHCGTEFTAITHRINDGFCMPCCDPFPGIKGTKHLLTPLTEPEVDAELAARGMTVGATFHRWLRIKSRAEPGDRLVRFRSDLQQTSDTSPPASRPRSSSATGICSSPRGAPDSC